jgi:hypothetical protein
MNSDLIRIIVADYMSGNIQCETGSCRALCSSRLRVIPYTVLDTQASIKTSRTVQFWLMTRGRFSMCPGNLVCLDFPGAGLRVLKHDILCMELTWLVVGFGFSHCMLEPKLRTGYRSTSQYFAVCITRLLIAINPDFPLSAWGFV